MIGSTRRAFGLLAAVAAILLTSTAGVCNADGGRLELRQNVVGGVAETTMPAVAGAAAAATTEEAAGGLLATTAELAPGVGAAATTPLNGAGVAETTAALETTAIPGAVHTTPTAVVGAGAETTALTHTTSVTTPKTSTTPVPAATTTSTTQAAVPNPGGAVGGGNGSPVSSTSSGAPNVVTATVGSGGVLEYASCIDFESKCNDSCSFGIFMMNCESGGACVCYQSNPDETTGDETDGGGDEANDKTNNDADDTKTSGASGFLSSVRSSFRTASLLSVLPAIAMLAATAAFI
ncbi:hypothetical protein IWW48_002974 [Coemansia sp. RSA 1200]|nr:hypothetical protein IWW48_002974 [Coemansia sp. RSA 1200]